MTIDEIFHELNSTAPGYRWEAVEAAVAQREAITPRLLALLDEAIADPQVHAEDDSPGLAYAIVLLGHFGEAAAHERFLALARLPEELIEALLGDMVSETMPIVLWRTAHGRFDGIRALLSDQSVYGFMRWGAARILAYAAAMGETSREETLAFLDPQLSDDPDDEIANSGIALAILGLQPTGYEAHLRQLWDEDCIDPWSMLEEDIDEALERSVEESLALTRETFERHIPLDIHDYLSHWPGFAEPGDSGVDDLLLDDFTIPLGSDAWYDPLTGGIPGSHPGISRTEKKKARKQGKAAKKARKKNREKRKK
jgi:hypothetical protein